jgi:hypothetical protein
MTETIYFLSGFLLCMVIALIIIAIIHKKLCVLLSDLCSGELRAQFWAYAVEVWFFLYSISAALKWCPEGLSDRQLFFAGIHQVKDGLSGMSTSIVLISAILIAFVLIRKFTNSSNNKQREENI